MYNNYVGCRNCKNRSRQSRTESIQISGEAKHIATGHAMQIYCKFAQHNLLLYASRSFETDPDHETQGQGQGRCMSSVSSSKMSTAPRIDCKKWHFLSSNT